MGDHFDLAQAQVNKAQALTALGEIGAALSAYSEALEREPNFPNYKTNAYLDFVLLDAYPDFVLLVLMQERLTSTQGPSRYSMNFKTGHYFRSTATRLTVRELSSFLS